MTSIGLRHPRLLRGVALACFGGVLAAFVVFERPGLGIAHFFYVPIVLAAMSSGALGGAVAGLVATALYAIGISLNPHLSSGTIATEATVLRLVTYVLVGTLIGHYASRTRQLLARADELTAELRTLARRDFVTGLPNQRAFETALNARIEEGAPFALVVCDLPPVGPSADPRAVALAFAERLQQAAGPAAVVARIGNEQFSVVAALDGGSGIEELVLGIERTLADRGRPGTVGWAACPRDGRDALALYTVAAERLYARKIARGEWEQPPASVTRIDDR